MTSQLTPADRLRRAVIVVVNFARNLAYHREGAGRVTRFRGPTAGFWRTAHSNFLDVCVLEWCKLFGDKRGARRPDPQGWLSIPSNPAAFEEAVLNEIGCSADEFETYRDEMRHYRDKFLAHLDSELMANIPKLDLAKSSVKFFHQYVTSGQAGPADWSGLPVGKAALEAGYDQCAREARDAYSVIETRP